MTVGYRSVEEFRELIAKNAVDMVVGTIGGAVGDAVSDMILDSDIPVIMKDLLCPVVEKTVDIVKDQIVDKVDQIVIGAPEGYNAN